MPVVVVRHDQPIAEELEGARPGLSVVDADTRADALAVLPDADAFVINPTNWDDEYLDGLQPGTWVQATSTGYAAFPLEAFEERDIVFTNAVGNFGPPVADHAFALILALARGVPACLDQQRDRRWDRAVGDALVDLQGRTLTVVGLGDVGESVVRRALGFDMAVYGTKRDPDSYGGRLPDDRVLPADDLHEVLPETDVLVLAVPLTDGTRGLVDDDALSALPDSALLVNVARGPVVDTEALLAALDAGELAGAGLDVFEAEPLPESSPLWDRDEVVVTPHVAGRSRNFVGRFVELFLTNYDRRTADEAYVNRIV
ncbi:D-2-hydroxyacid dehydrogenase [Halorarum halophilum]|uniref:D-2-hydroxyacid dehydrogenase n=1 Tax=Halorarum halophilum TaxID=2743090 RepID=A0A7D5KN68_9EURY|nr:D-2-hydroxyacid dehydrogenase [Halobaculum halophilum]QLG28282.1 D-2-hydroxyacid dehydrogenase [Halobaculum halophilum]